MDQRSVDEERPDPSLGLAEHALNEELERVARRVGRRLEDEDVGAMPGASRPVVPPRWSARAPPRVAR